MTCKPDWVCEKEEGFHESEAKTYGTNISCIKKVPGVRVARFYVMFSAIDGPCCTNSVQVIPRGCSLTHTTPVTSPARTVHFYMLV